ncbi:sugar transferase [Bailinhaonella thermotolerans]|uniref:Bacterial sugar transferase domain-containing protein n=1 Tax=Bailinhaonella thermotolerans TaxID=1070861 RepID=A0A3A4AU76_9ACTN|nr:sugar transferase [Bailinhaonella thermotolerans]RJL30864.1 hypothetical protein D5H75_21415 [Bailinhaonella thermotolerans]
MTATDDVSRPDEQRANVPDADYDDPSAMTMPLMVVLVDEEGQVIPPRSRRRPQADQRLVHPQVVEEHHVGAPPVHSTVASWPAQRPPEPRELPRTDQRVAPVYPSAPPPAAERPDPPDHGPVRASLGVSPNLPRRLFDIVTSGVALLLLAIPLFVLWAIVRLTSPGPGFFAQVRLGQGARHFKIYKFRSMRPDVAGPEVTADRDPRITPIGHFLRRTSLDELPQLWNVFKGDMTLVGPRPETESLAMMYPEELRWVFAHRPGLTGASQVRFRDFDVLAPGESEVDLHVYINKIVPARLRVEAEFLERATLRAALGVLWDTAMMILGRDVAAAVRRRGNKTTAHEAA